MFWLVPIRSDSTVISSALEKHFPQCLGSDTHPYLRSIITSGFVLLNVHKRISESQLITGDLESITSPRKI